MNTLRLFIIWERKLIINQVIVISKMKMRTAFMIEDERRYY